MLLIIVKLPTLHTLHFCCLLYTFAAFVVTKYHCVGAVLEQRQEQCWTVWMGACAEAEAEAEAAAVWWWWSRLQLSFCPLGLEFEAFVDGADPGANWQILFYFLLCSLNNSQKVWLWPQLVKCSDLQFKALYCWYMHNNLQVKWKYAIAAKI